MRQQGFKGKSLLAPGQIGDLLVREPHPGGAQETDQRKAVARVGDNIEEKRDIAGLLAAKEAAPLSAEGVGDTRVAKRLLQRGLAGGAAQEDENVGIAVGVAFVHRLERLPRIAIGRLPIVGTLDQQADAVGHGLHLGAFVVCVKKFDAGLFARRGKGGVGLQKGGAGIILPFPVNLRKELVDHLDDGFLGAEARLQMALLLDLRGKIGHHLRVGAAPGVDALLPVAANDQAGVFLPQRLNQVALDAGGVLHLVDNDIVEFRLGPFRPKEVAGQPQLVVEVDRVHLVLALPKASGHGLHIAGKGAGLRVALAVFQRLPPLFDQFPKIVRNRLLPRTPSKLFQVGGIDGPEQFFGASSRWKVFLQALENRLGGGGLPGQFAQPIENSGEFGTKVHLFRLG